MPLHRAEGCPTPLRFGDFLRSLREKPGLLFSDRCLIGRVGPARCYCPQYRAEMWRFDVDCFEIVLNLAVGGETGWHWAGEGADSHLTVVEIASSLRSSQ
jgi:hypothetical protein